jgi:hypothetical protein
MNLVRRSKSKGGDELRTCVADTVAQLITAFRTRRPPTSGDDFLSIEIPDLALDKNPNHWNCTGAMKKP